MRMDSMSHHLLRLVVLVLLLALALPGGPLAFFWTTTWSTLVAGALYLAAAVWVITFFARASGVQEVEPEKDPGALDDHDIEQRPPS